MEWVGRGAGVEGIAIIGARFYFDCVMVANKHDFIVPAHFFGFGLQKVFLSGI